MDDGLELRSQWTIDREPGRGPTRPGRDVTDRAAGTIGTQKYVLSPVRDRAEDPS
jgi:hypothetical protein